MFFTSFGVFGHYSVYDVDRGRARLLCFVKDGDAYGTRTCACVWVRVGPCVWVRVYACVCVRVCEAGLTSTTRTRA